MVGEGVRTTEPKGTELQSAASLATCSSPSCRLKDLNPQPTDYKSVALPLIVGIFYDLFSNTILMVEANGLEPLTPSACKANALPTEAKPP